MKYAIAVQQGTDSAVRVYAESYDCLSGRSTYVEKNLFGQWSVVSGGKKPKLWNTWEGASRSKAMSMLLESGNANARVIQVGPRNEEIRERAELYVDEIIKVLAAASVVPGVLSANAENLLKRLME